MQRKSQINYMKFAIFGNTYQAKKSFYAEQLFNLLGRYNAQISVCREFHHFLTSDLGLNLPPVQLFDGDDFEADMVISLGGDGTFLKAASRVGTLSRKSTSTAIRWTNAVCSNCNVTTRL